MLLLIYLLKHSYEREEQEIFTEIVKFLFHLSELRRFNDAFLSTLDDIHYFGVKKPNNRNHTEIQYLIEILDSEFMKTSVSPRIQLFYIAFLSNLLCCAKCKISLTKYYSNQSDAEYKNEDIDEYSLWINFIKEKLHGFISENSNSEDSFFYRSLQDWNNDSSNYIMIAFISLMKLCDNEDEIISAMNQYRIPEIITNESVFKSSLVTIEDSCKSKLNNLSHISFNTFIFSSFINLYVSNLIRIGVQIDQELKSLPKEKDQKGFLMGLMDKIQRLDEIACVADLKMLKYFNPEKGYSIKQDLYTGSNDTEDEGFYFCEESESEKTNLRETETTLGAQISKNEQILDYYGAMSIAVNVESKFGTENEQSFSTHSRIKKSSKLRNGLTSTSCKPCCSIF